MIRAALSGRFLASRPIAAAGSSGGLKRVAPEAAVCAGILQPFVSFALEPGKANQLSDSEPEAA